MKKAFLFNVFFLSVILIILFGCSWNSNMPSFPTFYFLIGSTTSTHSHRWRLGRKVVHQGVFVWGVWGQERMRLRKEARRLLIHYNLSWCHVLLSSSVCLVQWIFKFVIIIRIGYVFCRAQFEMKMWVGLPDLESQNRGLLVKCGFISALLRHNWQIKIVFKAYNPMFPCMYCEMVTTVKLANVSITISCWVWWDHL